MPDDERIRHRIVGGLNVAFGYGLFLVALALLGDSLRALEASPTPFLALVGRDYYAVASWVAWTIAVPVYALAVQRLAYRSAGKLAAQISRAYFVYLPAQVLGTALLWLSVRFLGLAPGSAALAVIVATAVLSGFGHGYLRFRPPLLVGEVPPEHFLRDHGVWETLEAFGRHARHAVAGVAGDLGGLPRSLALARQREVRPYVFAGLAYHSASAGVRAWHRIIHELNRRGMVAFSLEDTNPDWDERRITHLGYWIVRALEDPIVVYPEVVSGNPLRAGRVVRFVGNTPGYLGGDAEFADTELVFTWSKQFYDTDRILMVDTIESELFNDVDLPEKDTDCAYVGKAEFRGVEELPETFEMTHITRFPYWPSAREELAALLRRTRTLYTYDDCTMIIDEALLCGCEVILLPERRKLSVSDTAGRLTQQEYDAQLTRFIEETQAQWAT